MNAFYGFAKTMFDISMEVGLTVPPVIEKAIPVDIKITSPGGLLVSFGWIVLSP